MRDKYSTFGALIISLDALLSGMISEGDTQILYAIFSLIAWREFADSYAVWKGDK